MTTKTRNNTNPSRTPRNRLALLAACALATSGLVLGGCSNAGQGALSGASLGALAGFGLGSLSGDAGKGAAAGAILGGVGGAVLGDQNERASGSRSDSYHDHTRRDTRHRGGYGDSAYHDPYPYPDDRYNRHDPYCR